jgi:hypothetical protein
MSELESTAPGLVGRTRLAVGRWPVWLLAGAAGLNVVVLLAQLRGVIDGLYRVPDVALSEWLASLSGSAGQAARTIDATGP